MPASSQHDSWLTRALEALPGALPEFLKQQRWFAGKSDSVRSAAAWEAIPLRFRDLAAYLFFVRVEYGSGNTQDYAVPLIPAASESEIPDAAPRITLSSGGAILYDAFRNINFMRGLLNSISEGASFRGRAGELAGVPMTALAELRGGSEQPSLLKVEQSNTSVRYGERLIMKFFRKLEEGKNLDLEMGAFLSERANFRHSPPVAGAIEYRRPGAEPVTLALLQGYVRNQGDAWQYTLQQLGRYFQDSEKQAQAAALAPPARSGPAAWAGAEIPPGARERIGPYLEKAALLGRRTAELHLALAFDHADPDFRPEPFTPDVLREMSDSMCALARRAFRLLRARLDALSGESHEDAQRVLALEPAIFQRFEAVKNLALESARTRVHGDYHLGQVLYTGDDFIIIDFEGEPEWPLAERRKKRSPLRDVSGMLRSFHYASRTAAAEFMRSTANRERIDAATRAWRDWTSIAFMKDYLETASAILPRHPQELAILLDLHLLEKSVYELVYELNNRPEWVGIPLNGILDLF